MLRTVEEPFGDDSCELPVGGVKRNSRAEQKNRVHKLIHDTMDWTRHFLKSKLRNGFSDKDSAMRNAVRSKAEECQCFSTSSILMQAKGDAKYPAYSSHFFKLVAAKPNFVL
jgi:hypothetical protein